MSRVNFHPGGIRMDYYRRYFFLPDRIPPLSIRIRKRENGKYSYHPLYSGPYISMYLALHSCLNLELLQPPCLLFESEPPDKIIKSCDMAGREPAKQKQSSHFDQILIYDPITSLYMNIYSQACKRGISQIIE